MRKQIPDLPTTPMPAVRAPSKRRSFGARALLLLVVLVVVGAGAGVFIATILPSLLRTSQTTSNGGHPLAVSATANNQTGGGTTPISNVSPSVSSQQTTPTGTRKAGAPSVTHGKPHLGGPLTDFVGKYGASSSQGDVSSVSFWAGSSQSIVLNVSSNDRGTVTQIVVIGESSWTSQRTEQYCEQFLPGGAVRTHTSSTLLTYHSSLGTIELTLQASSTCALLFARS